MSKITKHVTEAGVVFNFGEQSLETTLDKLPAEIVRKLALHGLSQKVGDSYAGALNAQEAMERARVVFDGLTNGQWNTGRTGASGDVVEALAMETGKTIAECAARMAEMSKEQRDAVAKNVRIKAHIATIRARRASEVARDAAPAIDLEAMFS